MVGTGKEGKVASSSTSTSSKRKKAEKLSEEDGKLKADLEMLVERLEEAKSELHKPALEALAKEIRSATTSVTSVPKPLKFLRPHFQRLVGVCQSLGDAKLRKQAGSILSALAMTVKSKERLVLKYRLEGAEEEVGYWGQEYVKHLCGELGQAWKEPPAEADKPRLLGLAKEIVQFYLNHACEVEAVDLVMEMGQAELLLDLVDEVSVERVGLYLTACAPYAGEAEKAQLLRTARALYLHFGHEVEALLCAARLNDEKEMRRLFVAARDPLVQQQMALILARQQIFVSLPPNLPGREDLAALNSNANLAQYYGLLTRELELSEPKTPDDVYKTHLEPTRAGANSAAVDANKVNLAASFVSGFVNLGLGKDKLLGDDPTLWLRRHRDFGLFSSAASLGLVHRWDVDAGLAKMDALLNYNDNHMKGGTLLGVGIVASGINHDCDPGQALLSDYVINTPERRHPDAIRIGAIFGLGLAYINSQRESVSGDILPKLLLVLKDEGSSAEVQCMAALSIGLIRVGTGDEALSEALLAFLGSRSTFALAQEGNYRMAAGGLGLLWLRSEAAAAAVVQRLKLLPQPFGLTAATIVDVAAYAATGRVHKIQEMLGICADAVAKTKKEEKEREESGRLLRHKVTKVSINNKDLGKEEKKEEKKGEGGDVKEEEKKKVDPKKEVEKKLDVKTDEEEKESEAKKDPDDKKPADKESEGKKHLDDKKEEEKKGEEKKNKEKKEEAKDKKEEDKKEEDKQSPEGKKSEEKKKSESKKSEAWKKLEAKRAEERKKRKADEERKEEEKRRLGKRADKLPGPEAVAALGVGLIAMGEEIGAQMSSRVLSMLMRYGEPGIRRAVPLAIALTSISRPDLAVMESLAKLSHDQEVEVAAAGILGLGLVGAGTKNARLMSLLRQLAAFHARSSDSLLLLRIAQGLCHLGQGTCTLSPFHMEREMVAPASLAALFTLSLASLDMKKSLLGPRQSYLLYSIVPAIQPRHLMTFVQSSTPEVTLLEQVNVPVRVGQAVEVVGQVGKPKGITGFQSQTSPVLIANGERVELATKEYIPLSPYLEGIVLLKPNPDYHPPNEKTKTKTPAKA